MKVHFQVTFIIQPAAEHSCTEYKQPAGTWEVLGLDGLRYYWAENEEDAKVKASQCIASDLNITQTTTEEDS